MKGFLFQNIKNGVVSSLLVSWAALCAFPYPVQAQKPAPTSQNVQPQSDSPESIYKEATDAFQSGDSKTAAEKLEKVIAISGQNAQLETVYFTLGAAYFNLQDYIKAAETFQKLVKTYPKAERLNDALFSLGQAEYFAKQYEKAVNWLERLEKVAPFRERALLYEGMALKEEGKSRAAAAALEKLVHGGVGSETSVNGAIILASIYSGNGDSESARKLIQTVQSKINMLDNIMQLNSVLVKVGDDLLAQKRPEDALFCFRMVRSCKDVIDFQNRRIETIQKKIADNLTVVREHPDKIVEIAQVNNDLRASLAKCQTMLEDFQKLPDFRPALLLRLGASYNAMGRKWEAVVAYDEFLTRYPKDATRETGLYGIITVWANMGRADKVRKYGDQYLSEFKDGPNVDSVVYLIGMTAMQASDWETASSYFGRTFPAGKSNRYAEEMGFLLGNAQFMQTLYDAAAKDYAHYLKQFPKGRYCEEAVYRTALCAFFAGKYENALKQLNDYLKKFPKSEFLSDALYRKAVCLFAAQQYDTVLSACKAWEHQFGQSSQLAEVLALKGDALAAKNDPKAVDVYLESYRKATSDEVIHYSLFAAQKLLQKQGRWEDMGKILEEFVKIHPSHPDFLTAVYWIGKAKVHEGKSEEAKQFIAQTIKQSINDPNQEGVEQLLSQLAQFCARKKSRFRLISQSSGTSAVSATSSPSATPEATGTSAESAPTPTPADPYAEMDQLLGTEGDTLTAKARILYAKSEIARMRRQAQESQDFIRQIAENYKPEELSPMLLAVSGDYLMEKNEVKKASALFQRIIDTYPRCDMLDFAYNGLGEAAYRRGDYQAALRWFSDAIDKIGASTKLLDVTVGKAKTLLAMGRLDEAKKEFEAIASRHEWRGEATARSVYSLGQIAEQRNSLPEAIAFYQRVFVAYRRYLPWVAKAYLHSGECFEKLGKSQEALKTYHEMLKNNKLAAFPETKTAQDRLQALQAGGVQ